MRFCREQQLNNLNLPDDAEFLSLIPKSISDQEEDGSFQSCCNSEEVYRLLRIATSPVRMITLFAVTSLVRPLPPALVKVLSLT